jgi:hypothetical protein
MSRFLNMAAFIQTIGTVTGSPSVWACDGSSAAASGMRKAVMADGTFGSRLRVRLRFRPTRAGVKKCLGLGGAAYDRLPDEENWLILTSNQRHVAAV